MPQEKSKKKVQIKDLPKPAKELTAEQEKAVVGGGAKGKGGRGRGGGRGGRGRRGECSSTPSCSSAP